ncbi:hypothetical protein L195_g006613 [Trifolium pratense]|uniref:Uncharacterized protein n=1 Tax=Trifolium pratense TaxID=57577 RepID=A0A2K3P437_TRIPR|nr:hypothetical protein L195_g006613 [Trifolium pratense]
MISFNNIEVFMGVYITSYLQVAKSFASISDASMDKESGGKILIRTYSLLKEAVGQRVVLLRHFELNSLKLQELNFKCALHYQEDGFISMIMFECQEYFAVAVLHRKMIPRGQWLQVQSIEIFRFDHENVAGSLNCSSICIMLAVTICVNGGSVIVTKILLKWRDLPPNTWKFAANIYLVVAILHRKRIERGSVHVPLVLLERLYLLSIVLENFHP